MNTQTEPFDYTQLNLGIRKLVYILRSKGYNTIDSGDGKTCEFYCDQPMAYVHISLVHPELLINSCQALKKTLEYYGVVFQPCNAEGTTPVVEGSYEPQSNLAIITIYNVDDSMLDPDKLKVSIDNLVE